MTEYLYSDYPGDHTVDQVLNLLGIGFSKRTSTALLAHNVNMTVEDYEDFADQIGINRGIVWIQHRILKWDLLKLRSSLLSSRYTLTEVSGNHWYLQDTASKKLWIFDGKPMYGEETIGWIK